MAILYDGKGNQIIIVEGVKDDELTFGYLSNGWLENAEASYNSMMDEFEKTSYSGVPFFIQTDLHAFNNDPARWLHNKDKRVKNINLGDIVYDVYNNGSGETYRNSALPVANLITVYGNHEANTAGYEPATSYGLNYYYTDTTKGKRMVNERGFFTVCDDDFNVKYIVICPYYQDENGTRIATGVKTDQMTWLLGELSADDGYDVVILMHQLFNDVHYHRDSTLQNWADAPAILENLWTVMKDRRNKRSGKITDSDGVEHPYDFTNVKTRYLGSLHGHAHEELMYTEENTTAYVCDAYCGSRACCFGLFDRKNDKLKIWYFNADTAFDVLELDI